MEDGEDGDVEDVEHEEDEVGWKMGSFGER